jgi:hypothetical protein
MRRETANMKLSKRFYVAYCCFLQVTEGAQVWSQMGKETITGERERLGIQAEACSCRASLEEV